MPIRQLKTGLHCYSTPGVAFFSGLLSLNLILGASSAASAADANPADTVLYSSDTVSGWQGFYFGVSAGAVDIWSSSRLSTKPSRGVFGLFGPLTESELASLSSELVSSVGAAASLQGGFNHRMGRFLVGGEADVNLTTMHSRSDFSKRMMNEFCGGTPFPICVPASFTYGTKTEHEVPWFATARARFGYLATEQLLVYGTGGLALGSVRTKLAATLIPAAGLFPEDISATFSGARSSTRIGAALGGGLEYALTEKISLKAEYLYVNLGSASSRIDPDRDPIDIIPLPGPTPAATVPSGEPVPFVPGSAVTVRDESKFHTLRIGINFRF